MTNGWLRIVVAAVLLACVLAIVISPFVDLPVTALRSRIAALLLQLAILAMAFLPSGYCCGNRALTHALHIALPASASPNVSCRWLC